MLKTGWVFLPVTLLNHFRGAGMNRKNRLIKEIIWFLCTITGGLAVFLLLCRLLNIELNLVVIVMGAISALLAVYIVRLTVWVFNKNMWIIISVQNKHEVLLNQLLNKIFTMACPYFTGLMEFWKNGFYRLPGIPIFHYSRSQGYLEYFNSFKHYLPDKLQTFPAYLKKQ